MPLDRVLKLLLALIFALTAFIFSEVVSDIPPFSNRVLRVIITAWFGLMGYALFPNFAKLVTTTTLKLFNQFINKVITEIMDQIIRLPKQNHFWAPFSPHGPIGGISITQPLILDTSAIIDGRILDIAKTGFCYGTILIPSFVLTELQHVADSADFLKRARGRKGFETVEELKKTKGVKVEIWDKEMHLKGTVDEKLIRLAKNLHGRIITTDFNLNRVASLANIVVLNVNELSNAVKTVAVPGEQLTVKVVHIGKDPKQGVGYLPDGTMIVVEDGADQTGHEIKTEVVRMIQVAQGRMVFTRRVKG